MVIHWDCLTKVMQTNAKCGLSLCLTCIFFLLLFPNKSVFLLLFAWTVSFLLGTSGIYRSWFNVFEPNICASTRINWKILFDFVKFWAQTFLTNRYEAADILFIVEIFSLSLKSNQVKNCQWKTRKSSDWKLMRYFLLRLPNPSITCIFI